MFSGLCAQTVLCLRRFEEPKWFLIIAQRSLKICSYNSVGVESCVLHYKFYWRSLKLLNGSSGQLKQKTQYADMCLPCHSLFRSQTGWQRGFLWVLITGIVIHLYNTVANHKQKILLWHIQYITVL